jgi:hypothetical protein
MTWNTKKLIAAAVLAATLVPSTAMLQSPANADSVTLQWGGDRGVHAVYSDNDDRDRGHDDHDRSDGFLNWSGDVDDRITITIHGRDVHDVTNSGQGTTNINVDEKWGLPEEPGFVILRDADGRGTVQVLQQPRPGNDYTAVVQIYDPQPGRAHYHFTLGWRPIREWDGDRDRH